MHVKKNDTVYVTAGKERGKKGKIIKIFSGNERALVEGLNIVKRHTKPSQETQEGGILEKEAPLHLSNLLAACEKCAKGVRTRTKKLEDGRKVRCCTKCGEQIDV